MSSLRLIGLVMTLIWAASGPAHAQIAFRAASTADAVSITPAFRAATSATSTTGTLTITTPTGTAGSEVLVASIAVTPSSVSITAPSGWTLVRRLDNAGPTSNSLAVYYKVTTTSEPASYAWSVAGASFAVGGIQRFSGVDTASPVVAEGGQSTASGLSHAAPAVSTTVANSMLVASHAFASASTWSAPSGMTESFDRPSGSGATGLTVEGSRVLQAVAGSSGSKTATAAGSADAGNAHLLALRPSSANLFMSIPFGTAVNDVMIASIAFNNSTAAITAPPGWTLVRRMDNSGATANSLAVYRRIAGPGEFLTHLWGIAGGTFILGGIQSFSGVDTLTPIDAEAGQSTPSATAHDTPSITTTMANTMLVTSHTFASSQSWTPQAGLTESFDRGGAGSATGQSITGGRQAQAAAGASGAKRSTAAGSADRGNTHILALRPRSPNAAPTVSITSPANGTQYSGQTTVNVTAAADDSDGTVASVRFQVLIPIGGGFVWLQIRDETDSVAPYTLSLPVDGTGCNPPCRWAIKATALDNRGTWSQTAGIEITASPNTAPSVSLTSPAANATFNAPAHIPLQAQASDPDGSIASVDFYSGTTLITTLTAPPYTFNWSGVPPGSYSLTAKATDNLGATTTSAPVPVTVNLALPTIFGETPKDVTLPGSALPEIGAAYASDGSTIDLASVRLQLDGQDITSLATVTPAGVLYLATQPLAVSTHTVSLSVANVLGAVTARTWSFTVDDPAPNFHSETPRDVFLAERRPRIRVLLSGFNIVPSSVRISLDGADVTSFAQVAADRIVLDPVDPLSDGVHTVSVTATDGRGLSGGKQWSFTVELPPPPPPDIDGVRTERTVIPQVRVLP